MADVGISNPLQQRDFRLLFLSQAVSTLGDWLGYLAILLLVTVSWHYGTGGLALVVLAIAIPPILMAPVVGVIADRVSPRLSMVTCDLARAALVAALVSVRSLPLLVLIVFARDIFGALFNPSVQVVIKHTVEPENVVRAGSLSMLATQSAKIVGPAAGGFLVALLGGPRPIFLIDAATFLVSALLLTRLRVAGWGSRSAPEGPAAARGAGREALEGLSYLWRSGLLRIGIGGASVILLFALMLDTLGPVLLHRMGLGERMFGVAIGMSGLGALVGVIVLGEMATRWRPLSLIGVSAAFGGVAFGVIAYAVSSRGLPQWAWIVIFAAFGVAAAGIMVGYEALLQRETEAGYVGRVSAIGNALQSAGAVLAPAAAVGLVALGGVAFPPVVAGVVLVVIGLYLCAASPRLTSVNHKSGHEEPELSPATS